jgi:hypothetical protein
MELESYCIALLFSASKIISNTSINPTKRNGAWNNTLGYFSIKIMNTIYGEWDGMEFFLSRIGVSVSLSTHTLSLSPGRFFFCS